MRADLRIATAASPSATAQRARAAAGVPEAASHEVRHPHVVHARKEHHSAQYKDELREARAAARSRAAREGGAEKQAAAAAATALAREEHGRGV